MWLFWAYCVAFHASEWNITVRWIIIIFGTHVSGPHIINPNDIMFTNASSMALGMEMYSQLVHNFLPSTGWTEMKFCADFHCPQRMIPSDFSSSATIGFWLSQKYPSTVQSKVLTWHLVQKCMALGGYTLVSLIPRTFPLALPAGQVFIHLVKCLPF